MKIGFAYDSAYPWFNGGVEKRRFLIMQQLAKAGHQVHFFTMYREGMPSHDFVYEKVHYHCASDAVPSHAMYKQGRRNMEWPIKYAIALSRIIWSYKLDMIDADAFPYLHLPTLATYCALNKAKFVVTWIEIWDKKYWESYIGKALGSLGYAIEIASSKLAKTTIAISHLTKSRMVKQFKLPGKNVVVFQAAISKKDVLDFKKKGKIAKANQFIAIGRLVPQKRIDMAIRALQKTDANLIIVGRGPEKGNLEKLARRLGMQARVKFIESLKSDNDVRRQLAMSRALLMFSEREGLSIISIEALALGTPVIISDKTELTLEIRRHCHQIEESKIPTQIAKMLSDKSSILYKSHIPTNRIVEEFCVERSAKVYEQIYKSP